MPINRLLCIASVSAFLCAAQSNAPTHSIFNQNDVSWSKGPASLPPGAEVAVLEGDPAKEGQFTMRLRLPDGYKVPPHWHPKVEHVTVFSGDIGANPANPLSSFPESCSRAERGRLRTFHLCFSVNAGKMPPGTPNSRSRSR